MPAPEIIHQLVANFEQNREAYRSGKYNEARLRQAFLDKFFEALGWDVYNKSGYAPENCEVVIEDSLEVEGTAKSPDYTFRMGRERKFFVEAKKPKVDIKYDIHPAYQLRRYAWNAHMPLSILTDFEELAVYNCKSKPDSKDSAATARDKFFHYTEYIDRWDELAAIFSRDAVWKGSFDKFAAESKGKKGTTEVDDEILKDIENWRILLAHNIALRNKPLIKDEEELNYAVQMTIDRILFLRICEDRAIEPEEQLKTLAASPGIYPRLVELFRRADTKYNSGLFHLHPEKGETSSADTFTPSLTIDDKVLKEIISDIYYPCPYIFKEIPVEILGQVYEQFLGKVIRLTPAGQAKVEDKPEVRKAGGVYYTPTYIVDYIVQNTVGELLKDKTPEQASTLKIVDPACGSGSFLLGAFKFLLNWHYEYYTTHQPETMAKRKNAPIFPIGGGWRLTTSEKKRILSNNLFGVDIDPQAVEVTKLSLLLKVLEEESGQLTFGFERVLPDLGRNIQCGNSLIGWDYFEGQLTIDEEERKRVNPFDWQRAFPQVFAQGGFDVVIGNPPYVRAESLPTEFKNYLKGYKSFRINADIYVYFYEKSHLVLKKGGLLGFITSGKFLKTDYGKPLRSYLKSNSSINQIIDFGELPVFENASTFPIVLITKNGKEDGKSFSVAQPKSLDFTDLDSFVRSISRTCTYGSLDEERWAFLREEQTFLKQKIVKSGQALGIYLKGVLNRGILTGLDEAFIITEKMKNEIVQKNPSSSEFIKPYLIGDDIRKFRIQSKKRYLIFFEKGWTKKYYTNGNESKKWAMFTKDFPLISTHLEQFKDRASRRTDKGDFWWELRACDYHGLFNLPKIVWPEIARESRFSFDDNGFFLNKTCFFTPTNDLYLLGLLNSKLIWFYLKSVCSVLGDPEKGGRLMLQKIYVEKIPIHQVENENRFETELKEKIIHLVERVLNLNLLVVSTPQEKERIARDIAATDRAIDTLVYKLYNLTPEEIAIVEGS